MKKPNILLITTDSQRWDTLSCMGSTFAISPNLDRLAKEGVLFEQGHTSSPVCSAARSSLMTGVHTPVHGCLENGLERRTHFLTIPDYLRKVGYRNIMVGKTHFGPIDSFDIQHVVGEKFSNIKDCYAEHITKHGYSRVSDHPNSIPEDLFMEAFLVDKTIEEMEKSSKTEQPFFAFCSMVSPHEPMDPPGKWATLYDDIDLPELNYIEGEIEAFPEHMKILLGFKDYFSGKPLPDDLSLKDLYEARGAIYHEGLREKVEKVRKLYYGLAAYCDHQTGRLLRFLDETGLRENTLVIFSSDHGLQLFDHGFNDKHNYYDESWRVPFMMSMPGTLPEGKRERFATWNDIGPTILGAAGIHSDSMQGFDLFTPLIDGDSSPRQCAVATLFKSAAVASEKWKLEYYFEEGTGRLFDRRHDPQERNDLFHDEAVAPIKSELVQALLTWRADIMDLQFHFESVEEVKQRLEERQKTLPKGKKLAPVATRIVNEVLSLKGSQPEERLNERIKKIDQMEYGLTMNK
ncbi:sulfatase [Metabacillus niabensis]|uniref:sulfatase family protein n=1 Tax=Metabacillus niabensis TaxID=324854 RepID=UPI001CFA8E05|nr:sulfatase-like hydrolase/transferase [Metabacillus niabensis]